MPAAKPAKLSILTFPQHWKDGVLTVRFLCVPKGNPELALGAEKPFATADLVFTAHLIPGLDELPRAAAAKTVGPLTVAKPPSNKAALFAELKNHFTIVDRPPGPRAAGASASFRKPLAESYRCLLYTSR